MKAFRYFLFLLIIFIGSGGSIIHSHEKHLIVIVPSYNNKNFYKKNLDSIFMQKYNNYLILYIDDCSNDGTGQLVQDYVQKKGQEHRVQLLKNTERKGAMANWYRAIHSCPDDAIIISLDGDDWLKHDQVLETINLAYEDPNVWMTYGQFESSVYKQIGFCADIPKDVIASNAYRESLWMTTHLRTFYAWLFKKIELQDLLYQGNFFKATCDQAMMLPMLEMAAGRLKFIPDILYVYNEENPINDFRVRAMDQLRCEKIIRSRKKYKPLPLKEYL